MTIQTDTYESKTSPQFIDIHSPHPLGADHGVWRVVSGRVDLYAVPLQNGHPNGVSRFLLRLTEGALLFDHGWHDPAQRVMLLARGNGRTLLQAVDAGDWEAILQQRRQLEAWIVALGSRLATGFVLPQEIRTLAAGETWVARSATAVRAQEAPLWVQWTGEALSLLGQETAAFSPEYPFPLSHTLWAAVSPGSVLSAVDTATALAQGWMWPGLAALHQAVLAILTIQFELQAQQDADRLRQAGNVNHQSVQRALVRLATVLEADASELFFQVEGDDPLLAACRLVGGHQRIEIHTPQGWRSGRIFRDPVDAIAAASRIRVRRVVLAAGWWQHESEPMLAFWGEDSQPVAILPDAKGQPWCYDPAGRTRVPVAAGVAANLQPFAYVFYRSLPDQALDIWAVLRFGLAGSRRDLWMVLLTGLAVGFLSLAPMIVARVVIDSIIPAVNTFKLVQLTSALVVAAIAVALFTLVRGLALLRTETRMSATIGAALWDRLLKLPASFFRKYAAGDLATRLAGVDAIRRHLTGVTLAALLSGLFALVNLILLFFLDGKIAWLALGLVGLATVLIGLAGAVILHYERPLSLIQARLSGSVLQLLNGISKLRVAGAEARAFAVWAEQFSRQRKLAYRVRTVGNLLSVFNAAFPTLALAAILAVVAAQDRDIRSTGTIVAFIGAFSTLLAAGMNLSANLLSALRVVPQFENLKPILTAVPEVDATKIDPGELGGDIEVNRISFRYHPEGPLILQDVSFYARPGEFVAIVGPSGSGKSTLLRLLLGFETVESGSIYYDGQDLSDLDLRAVRRQIGVVLQTGRLLPGDILGNIVGSTLLSLEDAWAAARLAGMEEEIRQMPMGMHTVVSEAGGAFSGGQRQRLLIARAIVNRPRLLFFDEATSALDNHTQAIVSRSLEQLHATRIVIAHRLSTIQQADRIYVLESGRVVQTGTYGDLAAVDGPFRNLIRRQQL
jgi:ATP-binding cassette subfamily C protein